MSAKAPAIAAGAAGVAAAGTAILLGQYPTFQVYGTTIFRERGAGKLVALTYDDGPNPEQTPRLLDLLERHGAKATFFLIGQWAEREPGLIRETVARGHALGDHTHTHVTMPAHGA
jgi:peptidoglycan/xylan/chitin deacetylase (PgdA/CDA1 family)